MRNRPSTIDPVTTTLLLAKKIKKYNDSFQKPSDIILHGGEPGLIGLGQLEEIVDGIHQAGAAVSFVTNLAFARLNDRWLALLARFDHFGVSLNGDERGNAGRAFKNGRASFPLVTRNLRALREAKVQNYGIICTVTRDNVGRGFDTAIFLHSLCTDVKILPMDQPNFKPMELATFLEESLRAFLVLDDPEFRLSSVDEGLRLLKGIDPLSCTLSRQFACKYNITVKLNGDVLPCDSVGVDLFQIGGNLFQTEMDEILSGPKWSGLMHQFESAKKSQFHCACTNGVYLEAWQKYVNTLKETLGS